MNYCGINTFQPKDLLHNFHSFAIPIFPGEITFRLEEDEAFHKIFCSRNYRAQVLEPLEPISRIMIPSNTFTFDQIKLKRYNEMTDQNNLHTYHENQSKLENEIVNHEQDKTTSIDCLETKNEEKINLLKRKLSEIVNNTTTSDEILTEDKGSIKINEQTKPKKTKTKTTDYSKKLTSLSSVPFQIKHFIECYNSNTNAKEHFGENVYVYFQLFDLLNDPFYKKHRPIFDDTNFDICFMNDESNKEKIKHAKILERKALCDNIVPVENIEDNSFTSSDSLQIQDQYFWFLLHGLKVKDEGYLHNKAIDYIIQELENEYWFFDRELLAEFIYEKLPQDGSTVSVPKDAIYQVLKMGNRREMKTLIPADDIKHLIKFILPITKS